MVTRYENKPVLKQKANDGSKIKKEIFYFYICPRCDREVIEIHRYSINKLGKLKKIEKECLYGENASIYLDKTVKNRKRTEILAKEIRKFSKSIPLVYYKAINSDTQRPRYVNELSYAGNKIKSEIKLITL